MPAQKMFDKFKSVGSLIGLVIVLGPAQDEAAAKLPPKTGGSSKNLTICNLRSSLMRITAEFSIFYPYFWGAKQMFAYSFC